MYILVSKQDQCEVITVASKGLVGVGVGGALQAAGSGQNDRPRKSDRDGSVGTYVALSTCRWSCYPWVTGAAQTTVNSRGQ
jgi:hypothetical protein